MTERATLWPWDTVPIVQDIPGNWIADETGCSQAVSSHIVTDYFTPGGTPSGTSGPGSGACGPSDGGSDGPGDGTCSGPSVGPGSGGGSSGGGGCFLTEAVVGHRGVEADDGPTLTALRTFRDGYMQETPARRALVDRYYEIAPLLVAAIPKDHPEWAWIGERVDDALAAIGAGDGGRAFAIYVDMVRHLEERWLRPAAGEAS